MTLKIISLLTLIFTVAIGVWRQYFSTKAQIKRLRKKVEGLRNEMLKAEMEGNADLYHTLRAERLRLNREIARLSR